MGIVSRTQREAIQAGLEAFLVANGFNTVEYKSLSLKAMRVNEVISRDSELGMQITPMQMRLILPFQAGIYARVVKAQLAGTTVTLTTNGAHGLVAGRLIQVEMDANDARFDGHYKVASAPTSTTLTYTSSGVALAETMRFGSVEGVVIPGDVVTLQGKKFEIDEIEVMDLRVGMNLSCRLARADRLGF
jgi:hypothetical protein